MLFHQLPRKLKRNVEDYGIYVALTKALLYLLRGILEKRTCRIYAIDLDQWEPNPTHRSNFRFIVLTKGNPVENGVVKQIESTEEWLEGQIKKKLQMGGICLLAMDKDKVAGFNLIGFGQVYIPLLRITEELAENEAWSEQITILKDYRRRNLATDMRYRVFEELGSRGIKTFYGGTLKSNKAALGLARKVGFKELIDVHYLNILGHKLLRYENIRQ